MKTLSVFARVIGGVGDESTVVIDDDGEVGGEGVALGVGKFGTGTEVGHPEIVWKGGFEGFSGAMNSVELGATLTKKASISEKAIDGSEGGKVFAFVLDAPSLVGNFDRDLGMHFALFNKPGLLGLGETSFVGDVRRDAFGECFEAAFLVGIPPVFESANGVKFACGGVGPWA